MMTRAERRTTWVSGLAVVSLWLMAGLWPAGLGFIIDAFSWLLLGALILGALGAGVALILWLSR